MIYASRNGLNECELFSMVAGLTWTFWAMLCDSLEGRHVLIWRSGLLIFTHHQVWVGDVNSTTFLITSNYFKTKEIIDGLIVFLVKSDNILRSGSKHCLPISMCTIGIQS